MKILIKRIENTIKAAEEAVVLHPGSASAADCFLVENGGAIIEILRGQHEALKAISLDANKYLEHGEWHRKRAASALDRVRLITRPSNPAPKKRKAKNPT